MQITKVYKSQNNIFCRLFKGSVCESDRVPELFSDHNDVSIVYTNKRESNLFSDALGVLVCCCGHPGSIVGHISKARGLYLKTSVIFNSSKRITTSLLERQLPLSTFPSLLCVFYTGASGGKLRKDKRTCPIFKRAKKIAAKGAIPGMDCFCHNFSRR